MGYTIYRKTTRRNLEQLGRFQSRITRTVWRNRRTRSGKNNAYENGSRIKRSNRILERISTHRQSDRNGRCDLNLPPNESLQDRTAGCMGNGWIRVARPAIRGKLGHQKGEQNGSYQTHAARRTQQGKNNNSTNVEKSEWNFPTTEKKPRRSNGIGRNSKKTRIQCLSQRIPTKDETQFVPQMRQTRTPSGGMPKRGKQQRRSYLATQERQQEPMEATSQGTRNGSRKGSRGRVGKRRKSPVNDGLRDRTRPKPIEIRNLYPALNNTETLDNEIDHIMVQIRLHGMKRQVTINAMIDSGATEDFINKGFCSKYNIRTTQATKIREVYLADGRPSAMGPITHTAKVPMDIGSHRELATFQVAKLTNHEVILGMPWLKQHSPE